MNDIFIRKDLVKITDKLEDAFLLNRVIKIFNNIANESIKNGFHCPIFFEINIKEIDKENILGMSTMTIRRIINKFIKKEFLLVDKTQKNHTYKINFNKINGLIKETKGSINFNKFGEEILLKEEIVKKSDEVINNIRNKDCVEEFSLEKQNAPETQEQKLKTKLNQQIELIKNNINYNIIKEKNQEKNQDYFKMFNSIYKVIEDVMRTTNGFIKINGETKTLETVKNVFLKVKYHHIDSVINKFKNIKYEIKNFKAYIRTVIYNTYIDKTFEDSNSDFKDTNLDDLKTKSNNFNLQCNKNKFINYDQKEPDYNLLRKIELMALREGIEEDKEYTFNGVKIKI